jgi:hypothetical protein
MNRWFTSFLILSVVCGLFFLKSPKLEIELLAPLPNPPKPLFTGHKDTPSGLEFVCAKTFFSQKMLEPTLASFKKAEILAIDPQEVSQSIYGYLYTLFLAHKKDVLEKLFIEGTLNKIDASSPFFTDAALIFYRSLYDKKTPFLLSQLKSYLCQNPDIEKKLKLFENAQTGDLLKFAPFEKEFKLFNQHYKSPKLAFVLNLTLPGSGYVYLQQYQSALTCLLLFSLLIFAIFNLFKSRQTALAILCATVFFGFYWGSLVGVQEAASFYNKTLYTNLVDPILKQEAAYPELMIQYAP